MRIGGKFCMYTAMPGIWANFGRSFSMISSALGRSPRGFNRMKMRPALAVELRPSLPIVDIRVCA